MAVHLSTAIPVWVAAAIGAVLIGLFAPTDQFLVWLPVAMASAVLMTFVIQVSTTQKKGLVDRIMLSVGGAILVLAAATGVLSLIAAG
jgi:membrane protein implicated in regulation of membrane protease activity